MLDTARFSVAAFAFMSCVVLAACNSSPSSTSPTPAPSPANLSGDYSGTMQDAVAGHGTASGTLSQQGTTAGGGITLQGSTATVTAEMTLTVNSSNALSGAIVIDYPSGTTCTFNTTGTYSNNGVTAGISGSYTAVTNCSGDTGTYTLTQQCQDTIVTGERRRTIVPPHC
jgi:hypothetical protein